MEQTYSGKVFNNLIAILFFGFTLYYEIFEYGQEVIGLIIMGIFYLFVLYTSLDAVFSKIVVTPKGLHIKNYFPYYREELIPYESITHICSRISRTGWNHFVDTKERSIVINSYSNWKNCLLEISKRIDVSLFDLDVQKSIGIK